MSNTDADNLIEKTHNNENCVIIIETYYKKLNSKSTTSLQLLKIVNNIDFLIKNGSPKFYVMVNSDLLYFISKLTEYYDDEEDYYELINKKAKEIIELLKDSSKLKSVRDETKKLRDKIRGVTNDSYTTNDNGKLIRF